MSAPRYITTEELQSIFTALEERNTKYYDLQVELVDHIATGIERQYDAGPDFLTCWAWSISLGYILHFLFNNYRYFQREYQKAEQILAIHRLTLK